MGIYKLYTPLAEGNFGKQVTEQAICCLAEALGRVLSSTWAKAMVFIAAMGRSLPGMMSQTSGGIAR